jgi:hypothetical protein
LESNDERQQRLDALELSRRAAEHNDVSIQRLPGFGTNGTSIARWGTPAFFGQMSHRLRRRYIITVVIIVLCFIYLLSR